MPEHGNKVLVAVFSGADFLCVVLDVLPCALFFKNDTGHPVPDGVRESDVVYIYISKTY